MSLFSNMNNDCFLIPKIPCLVVWPSSTGFQVCVERYYFYQCLTKTEEQRPIFKQNGTRQGRFEKLILIFSWRSFGKIHVPITLFKLPFNWVYFCYHYCFLFICCEFFNKKKIFPISLHGLECVSNIAVHAMKRYSFLLKISN